MTTVSASETVPSDSMPEWEDRTSWFWVVPTWHQTFGDPEALQPALPVERQASGASTGVVNEIDRYRDWDDGPRRGGIHRVRFFLYGTNTEHPEVLFVYGTNTEHSEVLLVDWGVAKFNPEYQRIVDELQSGGRELLASEVIEMLRASQEDPEEADIRLFSLEAMAHFLIEHEKFADPVAGPDPYGIMQIEWHVIGNGLLVMAFLDGEQIHCVVQADASPNSDKLNVSVKLTQDQAVKEFSHLVPLR